MTPTLATSCAALPPEGANFGSRRTSFPWGGPAENCLEKPIIIIGAGLAGWTTARELRKLDTSTPLMLITADSGDFYAKPSLSNAFNQGRIPAQLVSTAAAKMVETLKLTLLANTRVLAIDPQTRTVSTAQGEFPFSQLVLATGAQPIRVPMAGDGADQVLSINSLDDFSKFHARLTGADGFENRRRPHVLIMGAGLIGCEFANDLAASNYQVSVVDPSSGPMAALLPAESSAQLHDALAALGVTWHFGATVTAVNSIKGAVSTGDKPNGHTLQVDLSNGHRAPVDMVLSAIGLRADTTLAQAAGLVCERGIVVDAALQTSAPHIYALGDGAQYASAGGRTLPYVMPIMSAARALAATLAGTRTDVVFPLMPVAIKTPALPIVVAAPISGSAGDWRGAEPGLWQFIDAQGQARGFVLSGQQTARRAEQSKLLITA
ncbi:FAD-dependent oxidoreductase [Rhodoferax ferrireducens]|uniref:FAD-dependent oxidoreductase n=1 Tax=Rhodoferax ferrireducens TaxID=192843 RepID=UPI000E0DE410|nr:FAD-dependent oxidoreductase [Rhodoferax ferrireducens]